MSERGRIVRSTSAARTSAPAESTSPRGRGADRSLRVPLPPDAGRDELVDADRRRCRGVVEGVGRRRRRRGARAVRLRATASAWLTHKLERLHGVDLRRELADALGSPPGVDRVPQRRGRVPARRVMGRCGTGPPSRGRRDARHRARQRVPRGRRDRRHRATCSARRLAAPRSVPGPARRGDGLARSAPRAATAIRGSTFATSRSGPANGDATRAPGVRRARVGARRDHRALARRRSSATCLVVGGSISRRGTSSRRPARRRCSRALDALEKIVPAAACRRRRAARRGAPCGRDGRPPSQRRSTAMSARRLAELTVDEARRHQASERPSGPVDPRVETRELDRQRADQALSPARRAESTPLRVVPGRRMGARHARHLGPRLELRRRRGAVCVRRRALPACAGAPVPRAARTTARGAALAGRGNGGQLGIDPSRIAVGGTSAGANLAAALTLAGREAASADLRLQVLVYPRVALRVGHRIDARRASRPSTGATSSWCWSHYLAPRHDGENSLASPLLARAPADCRRRSSSPPSTTRSATRASSTPRSCGRSGVDVEVVRIDRCRARLLLGHGREATSAQRLVAAALGSCVRRRAHRRG